MISIDKKTIAVNMHPALFQSLTARAEYMNISLAGLLEEALVDWLSETRDSLPASKQPLFQQHK